MQIAFNCKKGNNVPKAFQLIGVVNYTHNFTCVTNYNQVLWVYMDLFLILKAPNSGLFLGNILKLHNENRMSPFSAVGLNELCLCSERVWRTPRRQTAPALSSLAEEATAAPADPVHAPNLLELLFILWWAPESTSVALRCWPPPPAGSGNVTLIPCSRRWQRLAAGLLNQPEATLLLGGFLEVRCNVRCHPKPWGYDTWNVVGKAARGCVVLQDESLADARSKGMARLAGLPSAWLERTLRRWRPAAGPTPCLPLFLFFLPFFSASPSPFPAFFFLSGLFLSGRAALPGI